MLEIAALDIESAKEKPGVENSKLFMNKSLVLLKDRVEYSKLSASISDETISAVCCLAALEHWKRNMMAVKMHIDGLKQMVQLRGGLSKVRESSAAAAIVAFCMSIVAMPFNKTFNLA